MYPRPRWIGCDLRPTRLVIRLTTCAASLASLEAAASDESMHRRTFVAAVAVALLASCGGEEATTTTSTTTTTTAAPTTTLPPGLPPGDDTTVSRVIDGDTIEVSGPLTVRLIGADAPETSGGCFAAQATAHTAQLLPPGMRVRLAYDVGRTDRFGRTLAYVYRLTDGLFINLALARDGFAMQLTVPPNVAHAQEFGAAVAEARNARRGLWAACQTTTTTSTRAATTTTRAPTMRTNPGPGGNCSSAYPDVCIPPPPPDLDCPQISHRSFRVLPADPHGFDGNDNDGIGCESP